MPVIKNVPLSEDIAFHNYVFRRHSGSRNWGVERGIVYDGDDLVVFESFGNYRSLDNEISKALGIPLVPEEN